MMATATTQKTSDTRNTFWNALVRARSAEAARLVDQARRRYV